MTLYHIGVPEELIFTGVRLLEDLGTCDVLFDEIFAFGMSYVPLSFS